MLQAIAEEKKKGGDASLPDEECPSEFRQASQSGVTEPQIVCFEPLGDGGVVTGCSHLFCKSCVDNILAAPMQEEPEGDQQAAKYKVGERPCPTCRGKI